MLSELLISQPRKAGSHRLRSTLRNALALALILAGSPAFSAEASSPRTCALMEQRIAARFEACLESCNEASGPQRYECELTCEEKRTRKIDLLLARSCELSQRDEVGPVDSAQTIEGMVEIPGGEIAAPLAVVDGDTIFEGDIVVGRADDEPAASEDGFAGILSTARKAPASRWRNAVVPYFISPDLPHPYRVDAAIRHVEASSNLRFVRLDSAPVGDAIVFRFGTGCTSPVGRAGGVQYVTLENACSTGNVIHEIGHALGLWHEQSRSDRDGAITINWDNIADGQDYNFLTYLDQGVDGRDLGAFDLGSIMMYGPLSFSRNGLPTITRADGSSYSEQRSVLSPGDRKGLRQIYPSVPLEVLVHVDGTGDRTYNGNQVAGAPGQGDHLEGFQIQLDPPTPGVSVEYMARIEGQGNTPWAPEGAFVGTRGSGRAVEGFAIRLTGARADKYRVSYRAHVSNVGNTDFISDGELWRAPTGSTVEGITVRISRRR